MGKQEVIRNQDKSYMKEVVPAIRTGYTVKVTQKIKEGEKERLQMFEGLVIRVKGNGDLNSTITVRKVTEGVGVEKIFTLHSPSVTDVQITKMAKIRRSKLYYMRDRSGKSARLQETQTTPAQRKEMVTRFDIPKSEVNETKDTEETTEA